MKIEKCNCDSCREQRMHADASAKRASTIEKLFAPVHDELAPVSLTPEQAAKIAEDWAVDSDGWGAPILKHHKSIAEEDREWAELCKKLNEDPEWKEMSKNISIEFEVKHGRAIDARVVDQRMVDACMHDPFEMFKPGKLYFVSGKNLTAQGSKTIEDCKARFNEPGNFGAPDLRTIAQVSGIRTGRWSGKEAHFKDSADYVKRREPDDPRAVSLLSVSFDVSLDPRFGGKKWQP